MIRRKIGHVMTASAFVFAMTVAGAGTMTAFATDVPTPGSDLATDIQAGTASETATANDVDTAEEVNVDDGQVELIEEVNNGTDTGASTANG